MRWTDHGIFFQQKLPAYSSHAQLPVVDSSHPDIWRIYFSSRNDKNFSLPFFVDVEAGNSRHILQVAEAPLFDVGTAGSFDQQGVMPSELLKKNGKDYLYYIGWNSDKNFPFKNTIGLAIKDEGGTWQKQAGPIISGYPDCLYTGTLGIFADENSKLHGFYLACNFWLRHGEFHDPCYQIARASSDDGFHWQQPRDLAIAFKSDDEGGIVSARVLAHNGIYHMWYAHRARYGFRSDAEKSYRIGYAQSKDLQHWQRQDQLMDAFNHSLRDNQSACNFMQTYPYMVKHDETLFMFYNGNGFGQSGIAYATLPLKSLSSMI
jgi:hypothetical protein